jgi:hypothetical protein
MSCGVRTPQTVHHTHPGSCTTTTTTHRIMSATCRKLKLARMYITNLSPTTPRQHITICKRQLPYKCCTQCTTPMRHAQAGRHCQQTDAATEGSATAAAAAATSNTRLLPQTTCCTAQSTINTLAGTTSGAHENDIVHRCTATSKAGLLHASVQHTSACTAAQQASCRPKTHCMLM